MATPKTFSSSRVAGLPAIRGSSAASRLFRNLLEVLLQECTDVVAVQELERRFAHGVVPAGQRGNFVVQAQFFETQHHFLREFRQKRSVVLAIDQQRLL